MYEIIADANGKSAEPFPGNSGRTRIAACSKAWRNAR
jgi:hypothetical protein